MSKNRPVTIHVRGRDIDDEGWGETFHETPENLARQTVNNINGVSSVKIYSEDNRLIKAVMPSPDGTKLD